MPDVAAPAETGLDTEFKRRLGLFEGMVGRAYQRAGLDVAKAHLTA